jgi:hypothetical protein
VRRFQDNVNIDLQEFGCGSVDGFELAQNRYSWQEYANAVMNVLVPYNSGIFLTS